MVENIESDEERQDTQIEISHIQKIHEGHGTPRNSEQKSANKSPLLLQGPSQNKYKKHISTKINYQALIML
jgi:hypothetical protein